MYEKGYFSYVRVSTQRQGQQGTSLAEQTAAIERFAQRANLSISKRFEERETAAKTGRPVFLDMLRELKNGKAKGLVIHKIDRGARNLKDWAEIGTLIDLGIEVHFANESLDLSSRGGRLSADIQAVVAADFIRNLREETRKGIRGRVKQGLYPFPARVGYQNAGKGKPKEIDHEQAPLVRKAFELYASGNYGLNSLVEEMYRLGLRNKNGNKVTRSGIVGILRNPFYIGLIKVQAIGEIFLGLHRPIVPKELFDAAQDVLSGKSVKKRTKHYFVFRKHISCRNCQGFLIPERQKGRVYYRCHAKGCSQKTLREDVIEAELLNVLERIRFSDQDSLYLESKINEYQKAEPQRIENMRNQFLMRMELSKSRLDKLADAYMDGVFDKETYIEKKNSLVFEQKSIEDKLGTLQENSDAVSAQLREFLELSKSAYLSYKLGNDYEKRELLKIVTSNFTADGEKLLIKLNNPFQMVYDRPIIASGSPLLTASRTFPAWISRLIKYFDNNTDSWSMRQNAFGLSKSMREPSTFNKPETIASASTETNKKIRNTYFLKGKFNSNLADI